MCPVPLAKTQNYRFSIHASKTIDQTGVDVRENKAFDPLSRIAGGFLPLRFRRIWEVSRV